MFLDKSIMRLFKLKTSIKESNLPLPRYLFIKVIKGLLNIIEKMVP